jgi:hypothetical protein
VKSAGRAASEDFAADLQRHLDTWPGLRPMSPVEGGCLVVNHDHKLDPGGRPDGPYRRREFLATLKHPAIGTVQLFAWWCAEDWANIREAVFASNAGAAEQESSPSVPWEGPGPAMGSSVVRRRLFNRRPRR